MIAKIAASFTAVIAIAVNNVAYEYDVRIPLPDDLQQVVYEECLSAPEVVTPELIYAIIYHESRFVVDAVNINTNGTIDTGYGQINECNWEWLSEKGMDVHTPRGNIQATIHILSCFALKGYTMEEMLAAYARGETGMQNGKGFWFADAIHEIMANQPYLLDIPEEKIIKELQPLIYIEEENDEYTDLRYCENPDNQYAFSQPHSEGHTENRNALVRRFHGREIFLAYPRIVKAGNQQFKRRRRR